MWIYVVLVCFVNGFYSIIELCEEKLNLVMLLDVVLRGRIY